MFGATVAWGLDIGSSTIKAVKLQKTSTGVEVLDFDVIEIEHSDDESTRDMRNGAAIAELVRRKKFGRTPVVVSVAGNQVFFRPFNLPAVGERKVPEIVRYEARQQVPFPLEEVVWDYRVAHTGGPELSVSLVAIRKEIVERLLDSMREHDLNVVGLAPCPVAVLNYVQYDVQPMETCLVLDAGAKVSDFVVLNEGSFWFRPLPVAGDDITHVFEQKFRMPFAEAENLKTKLGESKQYEKMFQVIEPTLRSLAGEVQRTSGYYLSLQRNVRISRVFGLGHTFRLPGMADFLSENIEMELEMISSPQRIGVSTAIDTTWFAEEFPGMGPALGLALQGLGLAQVEMKLLPDSLVSERRAATRRKYYAAVAVAIWLLVASQFVDAKLETAGLAGEGGRNEKMVTQLKDLAEKQVAVREAGELIPARKAQLRRWSRIGAQRGVYGEVFSQLFNKIREHNRALRRTGKPPEGEIFLSRLLVTPSSVERNPDVGGVLRNDPALKGLIGGRRDGSYYVVAQFECRGIKGLDGKSSPPRFEFVRRFEKTLHGVGGFKGIGGPKKIKKAAPKKAAGDRKNMWLVKGLDPKFLAHLTEEWLKGQRPGVGEGNNAYVFWAIWIYEPAEEGGPASEDKKTG
jgi:type IV pilus assembly protein PilM